MTSVLNVDTIAAKDGTSPVALTKQQANKAHYSYDQSTNTVATEAFNISSVTDHATGYHYGNYTNSMAQANHPVTFTADAVINFWDENTVARTTSSTGSIATMSSGFSLIDVQFISAVSHGDLA